MWFTLHHNKITLPGIPPATATTQHPVWETDVRRRVRTVETHRKHVMVRKGCRWGQERREITDCRCVSEYTPAQQKTFTPSSLYNYGTHNLMLTHAQPHVTLQLSWVDGVFFHCSTCTNRAVFKIYRLPVIISRNTGGLKSAFEIVCK